MTQRDNYVARGWTRPAPAAPRDEYCAADDLFRKGFSHAAGMLVTALRDRLATPARRELFTWLDEINAWAEDGAEDAKPPRLPWREDTA